MSIANDKRKVFSDIAALRVSTEGFPKKLLSDSIKSITEPKANSVDFLTDQLKSLVGFESLKDVVVETLTQNLDEIEDKVKTTLKKVLKGLVSCSVNPQIPQDFIDNGISLEVENIDFLDIMRVTPSSQAGKLLYDDTTNGTLSTDFNTYLNEVIKDNGGVSSWGSVTSENSLLDIKFDAIGPTNNSILVKPSAQYAGTHTLTDLNNDYIDSIKLFDSVKLVNNIIEALFGSISVELEKDKKTIENEIQIDDIINRVLDADCDDVIDDSYFSFSNDETQDIQYRARMRRKGIRVLTSCGNLESKVPMDDLTELNNEFNAINTNLSTGEYNEIFTNVLRDGLDKLADASAVDAPEQDRLSIKINFIEDMLKKLMTAIVNVVLSPKLILIFALNHQIIYGEGFDDVQDFMKKNKWLLTLVLEAVRDFITSILLAKALKEIKKLVAESMIKTQIEKIKAKKAQLLSLVAGAKTDVLRKVSGLTKR
jgi:hypothetical protein